MKNKISLFVLFLVCALQLSTADEYNIDVHCTGEQTLGTWVLRLGPNNYDADVRCLDNFELLKPNTEDKKILLKAPDVAGDTDGNAGFWTMTYDEGFEVTLNGFKYFAFFDGNSTEPHCERTHIGWYHEVDGGKWGCFYALKETDGKLADPPTPKGGNSNLLDSFLPPFTFDAIKKWLSGDNSDSVFEMPASRVEYINSVQKSWRAAVYPQFQGKKMSDMQSLAGGLHSIALPLKPAKNSVQVAAKYGNLPAAWDWRSAGGVNYVTPVRNQGNCGSCYAFSTTAMMEIRIRIKSGNTDKPLLSPQHVVSCNQYSQGCHGGLPYLVGKFGEDFGVVPEECFPYKDESYPGQGLPSECSLRCEGWEMAARKFTNYRYVGNYYGNCTEVGMMEEIHQHGPIVIGIEVTDDLFAYQGGIYHRVNYPEDLSNGYDKKKYKWDMINHAVLLVGWGEDDKTGEKFWIVRNSWGTWWGEDGFFRIRRGTDESGVESLGMAADPIL